MNPRWRNIFVVAAIFLAGAVTGSLGTARVERARPDLRLQADQLQTALMDILRRELVLTPDQEQRVAPLVARACEDYRNLTLETVQRVTKLVEAANQRIERELTPAQVARLRELEAERQASVRRKLDPEYLKRDFLSQ
jgi:hypothetical protein